MSNSSHQSDFPETFTNTNYFNYVHAKLLELETRIALLELKGNE